MSGRFGDAALQHATCAEGQKRADHVYHPDVVAVALRLAHPRPRAVWRCTIDGPLCEGLAGGVREGGKAAGGASAPPRVPAEVTVGLSPRVNLNQHLEG